MDRAGNVIRKKNIIQMEEHNKPNDWLGWKENIFALEVQQPWSELILSGSKTIEVRTYPLPPDLVRQKLWILQSPSNSKEGVSSLGNVIETASIDTSTLDQDFEENRPKLVGWMIISSVKVYRNAESFHNEEKMHLVPKESVHSWWSASTQTQPVVVHGWCIDHVVVQGLSNLHCTTLVRRKRSLFEIREHKTGG